MQRKKMNKWLEVALDLIVMVIVVYGSIFLMNKFSIKDNTNSKSSNVSSRKSANNKPQKNTDTEANNAIKSFKEARGPANGYIFFGIGTYRTLNAELLHNDSDDSYKFALRDEGDIEPYVTFYLARIIAPNTDKYQYVAYIIDGSKHNYILQDAIRENRLAVIYNGDDAEEHNPLRANMDDIEDNFDLSISKKFVLHVN